jgi:hypothetical protein
MERTTAGAKTVMQEIKNQLTEGGEYDRRYDWRTGIYSDGPWIPAKLRVPAFFVFSQAGDAHDVTASGGYGDYFTSFIIEENLGTVQETEPALNQNSSNLVKVFLWTVNQDTFRDWGKPLPVEPKGKGKK